MLEGEVLGAGKVLGAKELELEVEINWEELGF